MIRCFEEIGAAIRRARKNQRMTQKELGQRCRMPACQISKLESGRNVTIDTISRVFKAMGVAVNLDMGALGRVALC